MTDKDKLNNILEYVKGKKKFYSYVGKLAEENVCDDILCYIGMQMEKESEVELDDALARVKKELAMKKESYQLFYEHLVNGIADYISTHSKMNENGVYYVSFSAAGLAVSGLNRLIVSL